MSLLVVVDESPLELDIVMSQKEFEEAEGGYIVAHASNALTDVEQRCSQTERETLPVVLGTDNCQLYIYGKSN